MCARTEAPPQRPAELTFPAFKKLTVQLKKLPVKTFVGHNLGEPLLTPRFINMLEHFDRTFSGKKFVWSTNASRLTMDFTQRFLALKHNRYEINFSLDAVLNSTYAKIHKRSLSPVKKNVVNFLKEYLRTEHNNITVVLNFIVTPFNIGEQKKFLSYWRPYLRRSNRIKIKCNPLAWNPALKKKLNYPVWNRLHPDAAIIRPPKRRQRPCLMPWQMLSVRANGDVGVCCYNAYNGLNIGNFLRTPIPRLLEGRKIKQLKKAFLKKEFQEHPLCYFCHA
jgi:MoaA/NifB/PqqE/SkfB family radical SAM enzyme